MNLQTLTDTFAIPGVLAFDEPYAGMARATITTPACNAELYLQGAHLTRWQPTGHEPVLFLSERSLYAPGKAIRGGIPIIWPWFGSRTPTPESQRTDGPSHGFARTADWNLAFAALSGDDLILTLALGPSETSRALGFENFQLAYQLTLGNELRLQLTVTNLADTHLHFEEAFHTYFSVGDALQISLIGLSDTEYLDKTDNFARKRQIVTPLTLSSETDRPYLNTLTPINLIDPVFHRRITVDKSNSRTTVIWNPWSELSAKLSDMTPTNWQAMTCIETANAADNTITLAPKEAHSMQAHIIVEALHAEPLPATGERVPAA
jgi:glucose-6-phosphate 1-epimerase